LAVGAAEEGGGGEEGGADGAAVEVDGEDVEAVGVVGLFVLYVSY
jgi:hypothetical protein